MKPFRSADHDSNSDEGGGGHGHQDETNGSAAGPPRPSRGPPLTLPGASSDTHNSDTVFPDDDQDDDDLYEPVDNKWRLRSATQQERILRGEEVVPDAAPMLPKSQTKMVIVST